MVNRLERHCSIGRTQTVLLQVKLNWIIFHLPWTDFLLMKNYSWYGCWCLSDSWQSTHTFDCIYIEAAWINEFAFWFPVHFDWYHFYRRRVLIIYSSSSQKPMLVAFNIFLIKSKNSLQTCTWYNPSYQLQIVKPGFLGVNYSFDKNVQTWWQEHCIFTKALYTHTGINALFVRVFLSTIQLIIIHLAWIKNA